MEWFPITQNSSLGLCVFKVYLLAESNQYWTAREPCLITMIY